MAVNHRQPPLLLLILLLITPTHSFNCSQQLTNSNNLYTNCTNLPTLNSSLHWTHVSKTSSLLIAFVAPPVKPDGWIAWGINPTRIGMVGSQALIAFKDSNGSMVVKTYNTKSYSNIVEGPLSFEVTDPKAEYSAGTMKIYASVKLPTTMTEVNHVWQVGGSVMGGMPMKHEFQSENLQSKEKLVLRLAKNVPSNGTSGRVGSPVIAPSPSTSSCSKNTIMYVCIAPSPSTSSCSKNTIMYVCFIVMMVNLISS